MKIFFLSILAQYYEKGTIRKQETDPKMKNITFLKNWKQISQKKWKKIPINKKINENLGGEMRFKGPSKEVLNW